MAYTNENANQIADFLSSKMGYDMPTAIASSALITQDPQTLDELDEEKLNHVMSELHSLSDSAEVTIKHVTELLNQK